MGTTADKGAYLNNTKLLLKQKINNLGGDIDNNTTFREYADELQEVYDNLPKDTGEGTEVSLNTIKGRMQITEKGNTQQDTTEGINKYYMNYNDASQTWQNLAITSTKVGYSISGTCASSGAFTLISRTLTLPAGNYIMVLKKPTTLNQVGLSMTSYTPVVRINKNVTSGSFTLSEETAVCLTLVVTQNETYNEENEVMVMSGTTLKPYEQYTRRYSSSKSFL